jgi:hypothetical protein
VAQGQRSVSGQCISTLYTYLKFRLSLFPTDMATVTLTLHNPQYVGPLLGSVAGLYAVNDDTWNENTLTWNNRPAVGPLLSQTTQVVAQPHILFPTSAALVNFINGERAGDRVASLALGWADCAVFANPQLRVDSSEGAEPPELLLLPSASP